MAGQDSVINVLLVEDDPFFVQLLESVLGSEPDIEVLGSVGTIGDASAEVRRHLPDVVLMDQLLPDGRGTDAARRIRKEFRTVRVVMLTATADDRTLNDARKAGCSAYVTKEDTVKIARTIRAAYRGDSQVPQDAVSLFLEPAEADDAG